MARAALGIVHIVLALPVPIPEVIVRLGVIADLMAKNAALFPSPPVPIPTFRKHVDDLFAAHVATKLRTAGLVGVRNAALLRAKEEAHALRGYVNGLANAKPADAAKLAAAAGMVLRRFGGRKAGWLTVDTLTGGDVKVTAPVLRGAVAYEWGLSTDDGKTYKRLKATPKASTTIAGLAYGTAICVRVRAVTRSGTSRWSVPVPFVVGQKKPKRRSKR